MEDENTRKRPVDPVPRRPLQTMTQSGTVQEPLYMRPLFSDGLNSLAHFMFGYATTTYTPIIFPIFVAYQISQPDNNTGVDLIEYGLGMFAGRFISRSF
jgi:hypothetical protein